METAKGLESDCGKRINTDNAIKGLFVCCIIAAIVAIAITCACLEVATMSDSTVPIAIKCQSFLHNVIA